MARNLSAAFDRQFGGTPVITSRTGVIKRRGRGCAVTELSLIAGLDTSNISRRRDSAQVNLENESKFRYAKELVEKKYHEKLRELHV